MAEVSDTIAVDAESSHEGASNISSSKPVDVRVMSSAKTRTFAKMVTPAQLKIGLVQVLEDQLPPPLSCKEFHDFLLQEHSEENIEFYFALRQYKNLCAAVPEELLRNTLSPPLAIPEVATEMLTPSPDNTDASTLTIPSTSPYPSLKKPNILATCEETHEVLLSKHNIPQLKETLEKTIMQVFFRPNCPREVNVPSKILKPLFKAIDQDGNIHPEVFNASLDTILTMMRLSSFPNFYKMASSRGSDDANDGSGGRRKSVGSVTAEDVERRKQSKFAEKNGLKEYVASNSSLSQETSGGGGVVGGFKKRQTVMGGSVNKSQADTVDIDRYKLPEIDMVISQPDIENLLVIADREEATEDSDESDTPTSMHNPRAKKMFEKAMGVFRQNPDAARGRFSVPVRPTTNPTISHPEQSASLISPTSSSKMPSVNYDAES
ncbi:hypothetical protein BDR26DRAFT_872156 [Obelidium mucronatum]|nr:hypothetical protein BDR26DRAFT_872156 [Obelidium mucronatum]